MTRYNNNQKLLYVLVAMLVLAIACKKKEYSLGSIKTPEDLTVTATVQGKNTANPDGDGSGVVKFKWSATNALAYKIWLGNGDSLVTTKDTLTYRYRNPGTSNYLVRINAIGTGGALSTTATQLSINVLFDLPADIINFLTAGNARTWVTAKETPGHFGVGPTDVFWPSYYSATPNQRSPCVYDDEITFSKDANNRIFMNVDNKGSSFIIGAATSYYGLSGGDDCYALNTGGNKLLVFSDAVSNSTSENSTRIQFQVPGNGIVNNGLGSNTYEILTIGNSSLQLRTIGADGLAWYQILKPKP